MERERQGQNTDLIALSPPLAVRFLETPHPALFFFRQVAKLDLRQKTDWTGDIVPGTVGNLCLDVRNSQVLHVTRPFSLSSLLQTRSIH